MHCVPLQGGWRSAIETIVGPDTLMLSECLQWVES